MNADLNSYLRSLLKASLVLSCAFSCCVARADIFVIVNAANPTRNLSVQEVSDLYLGRTRSYPNGSQVQVLDQPNERTEREQFFRLLANMPLAQVNAYWARLSFTGRQQAPEVLNGDQAVINSVSRSPQAIGYVGSRPNNSDIQVILQLRE